MFTSPLQMTPEPQSVRVVYMSACDDDLDLQGTEAKWSPQWFPRLAELCCTGTVMHALNMNLHLLKQVSSTFCGVMFALLIDNIQQFCERDACMQCTSCDRPRQGQQIYNCMPTLRLHVTLASRSSGVNGMALVQAALGYKYSVCSWAADKPMALSNTTCSDPVSCKIYVFSADRQTHLAFIQKR